MALTLRIEEHGSGEEIVVRQLQRFADEQHVPTLALEEVAVILRHAVERQFESEGGYASGGWKALAKSTVERKARLGLQPEILRATDRLMHSLTRKFDPEHVERHPSDASLLFGSTVAYGKYHQSSAPRTRLPFRPPVAITAEDKRLMVKRIQHATIEHMRGHGDKATWGAH